MILSYWTPLARALEQDYDVIMPDARDHGNSSIPDGGYSYNDFAADVIGLIDTLCLFPPFLLGHSMGGMTAALVACQNPNRLRGILDVGSVVSCEMAVELALLNKCLQVTQIKEAGHGIPYDQPKRFSVVVQIFLRSLRA